MKTTKQLIAGVTLALALSLNTTLQAGAIGGPRGKDTRIDAYATEVYHVAFRGGELAMILLSGDRDTHLDVRVYDSVGNLVAYDTGPTDQCVCIWTPGWTGVFRIEVRNLGGVFNRYSIRTN